MVFNLTYNPEGKEYISNNSLPSDSKTGEDKYGLTDQQYELVENEETLKRVFGLFEKEVYDYLATSA